MHLILIYNNLQHILIKYLHSRFGTFIVSNTLGQIMNDEEVLGIQSRDSSIQVELARISPVLKHRPQITRPDEIFFSTRKKKSFFIAWLSAVGARFRSLGVVH